jgi:hypothetical protein
VRDAANWFDSNGYNFDGVILDRKAFLDNFEDMMLNFRGFTVWSGGKYYLRIFTDDAPVMNLTEADVEISPDSFQVIIPGIPETPNVVKLTFADSEQNYTTNYAPAQDLTQIGLDGESRTMEKTLIGTNNMVQSLKLAKYMLLRNQWNKQFTILCHPRTFALEPGDMITLTHEFPNWNLKKLRVKDVAFPQDGMVPLTLMDEDASIYA